MYLDESKKKYWYILNPKDKFFSVWRGIENALLIYTAMYVPFNVAYLTDPSLQSEFMNFVDLVVDILFILMLIITFFCAYERANGTIEDNPGRIALNYLRGWFFIDFIASFPFGLVMPLFMNQGAIDFSIMSQQEIADQKLQ